MAPRCGRTASCSSSRHRTSRPCPKRMRTKGCGAPTIETFAMCRESIRRPCAGRCRSVTGAICPSPSRFKRCSAMGRRTSRRASEKSWMWNWRRLAPCNARWPTCPTTPADRQLAAVVISGVMRRRPCWVKARRRPRSCWSASSRATKKICAAVRSSGPAGRVLDDALRNAGLERDQLYITNAVKHFKWQPRGKRRLHKRPDAAEVAACNHWLDAEVLQVKPRIIVALGASALRAVAGLDRLDRIGSPAADSARQRRAGRLHLSSVRHSASRSRGSADQLRDAPGRRFASRQGTRRLTLRLHYRCPLRLHRW